MLEADNFIKLFIHELAETLGGKCMDKTNTNELSANSQQAKTFNTILFIYSRCVVSYSALNKKDEI